MKKIFLAVVVALFSINVMAQHEIGGVVGGLYGLSHKYWFSGALAVQTDLAVGLTQAATMVDYGEMGGKKSTSFGIYDFTINPNVEYHWALPVENLKIYAGGGINFGLYDNLAKASYSAAYAYAELYQQAADYIDDYAGDYAKAYAGAGGSGSTVNGKFGINAIVGLQYNLKSVPLALAFDFRPGYGLGFNKPYTDYDEAGNKHTEARVAHFFDWKLAFAVRYCL